MKLTVTKPVEIEAAWIGIEVPVRYGTEDIPADCPMRTGDLWRAVVDIHTGVVRDWPQGAVADVDMKVVDQGIYTLLDSRGGVLATLHEEYVPGCIPGRYGDYVELAINAAGQIERWGDFCTPDRVAKSFFPRQED